MGPDGRFIVGNINEWQHSAMYFAFMLSGAADLAGYYGPPTLLPDGTEHVRTHAYIPTRSTLPQSL